MKRLLTTALTASILTATTAFAEIDLAGSVWIDEYSQENVELNLEDYGFEFDPEIYESIFDRYAHAVTHLYFGEDGRVYKLLNGQIDTSVYSERDDIVTYEMDGETYTIEGVEGDFFLVRFKTEKPTGEVTYTAREFRYVSDTQIDYTGEFPAGFDDAGQFGVNFDNQIDFNVHIHNTQFDGWLGDGILHTRLDDDKATDLVSKIVFDTVEEVEEEVTEVPSVYGTYVSKMHLEHMGEEFAVDNRIEFRNELVVFQGGYKLQADSISMNFITDDRFELVMVIGGVTVQTWTYDIVGEELHQIGMKTEVNGEVLVDVMNEDMPMNVLVQF